MPTCYVVMPYGGDNPAQKAKFQAVYENIIRDAAKMAGISEDSIIREDHSGDAGTIVRNIVNHIKNADIVVADLTGLNANVHYELGISHVFHKSSTVLICEKNSERAFDVQHLQIIEYSTAIEEFSSSKEKIADAIKKRLEHKTISDSPVHETISKLPAHLSDWIDADDNEQINRIAKLEQENEQLKKQLKRAGIQVGEHQNRMTPQEILRSGMTALPYSGNTAYERIVSLINSQDYETLLSYLTDVYEHGRLTTADARRILEACEKIDNLVVTECAIQVIGFMFPDENEFQMKLAGVYAKQPGKREEALRILDSVLGLKKDENGDYVSVNTAIITSNTLVRFFNAYLGLGLYDDLVRAGRFLLQSGTEAQATIIKRNIIVALSQLKKFDEVSELLPEFEKSAQSANDFAAIAEYYDKMGDMKKAYIYYERKVIVDIDDPDYPRTLAIHILNENLLRKGDSIECVTKREAQLAAGALLLFSVNNAKRTGDMSSIRYVLDILNRDFNGLREYHNVVIDYIKGEIDELPFDGLDCSELQYCIKKAGG